MLSARQVFDRVDDTVSAVLLRTINTPEVARALLDTSRFAHAALDRLDELRGSAVHLLSLPSHHDVRSLQDQVAALRVAIAEIEARLDDARDDQR